jgi:hypothetical protein
MEEPKQVKRGRPKNETEFNRKEYNKNYYEKNKNEILEKININVKCEICNCLCSKANYSRHLKGGVHLKNLLIKENEDYKKIVLSK